MSVKNRQLSQKQKQAILVGTALTTVTVGIICKRKINALQVTAAANAVQSWVDQNARAGFSTYLLNGSDVKQINSALDNLLPTAA